MCKLHFFQKCFHVRWNQNKVSWCCIETYHNFERNEDRATVFLKWTNFKKSIKKDHPVNTFFFYAFFLERLICGFWHFTNHFSSLHMKKPIKRCQRLFSKFSCRFLNPNNFFPIWIIIVLFFDIWETSRNKLKKHFVTKNCSDLSLFK